MPIRRTEVRDAETGNYARVVTIVHEGRPWLVAGGWVPTEDRKSWRPAKLIRPLRGAFKAGGNRPGGWADYVLSDPIPSAIIEGVQAPPREFFEVLNSPDIKVDTVSLERSKVRFG
jgi:hypothetical protein